MAQTDALKKYLDAGMAFTHLTRARAEQVVKDLVAAGDLQRNQAKEAIDELLERSRKNAETLSEQVRKEVDSQLASLGLARKADVERLEAELAELKGTGGGKGDGKAKEEAEEATEEGVTDEAPAKKAAPAKRAPAKKAKPAAKADDGGSDDGKPDDKATAETTKKASAKRSVPKSGPDTVSAELPAKKAAASAETKKAAPAKKAAKKGEESAGPSGHSTPAKKTVKKQG